MFNRTKIKDLERKLIDRDDTIHKLESIIDDRDFTISKLKLTIEEITKLKDKIPEDCIPGSYCRACEFAKKYRLSKNMFSENFYVCAKSGYCSEFIQKKGDC